MVTSHDEHHEQISEVNHDDHGVKLEVLLILFIFMLVAQLFK